MRLIDADVLLDSIFKSCNTTEATINNAPTIDAVEVVRCRDCRFSRPTKAFDTEFGLDCTYERGDWKRVYGFSMVSANGFCDEGKRREKNSGKGD